MLFLCENIWENYLREFGEANERERLLHETELDLEREAELAPFEPCEGMDREYVDVAVARELRLM